MKKSSKKLENFKHQISVNGEYRLLLVRKGYMGLLSARELIYSNLNINQRY